MSELWESIVKREIDKYLTIIIVIIMNTSSPVDPGRILDPGQCSVIVLFEQMRRSQETRLRNICSQKYSKVVLNVFFSVFCFAALFSFLNRVTSFLMERSVFHPLTNNIFNTGLLFFNPLVDIFGTELLTGSCCFHLLLAKRNDRHSWCWDLPKVCIAAAVSSSFCFSIWLSNWCKLPTECHRVLFCFLGVNHLLLRQSTL